MTDEKKKVLSYIDEKADVIIDTSDKIWDFAELSLREFKSGELYAQVLKEEGFEVEHPFCGIETAFRASYGSGKPVIGILAEYDALTGLSQVAGQQSREELVSNGNGHGCGHNLLGAGSMAAAFAIKHYLEEKGEGSGKVILYGCPGEEGAATKAFMARDGVFKECDAALTWHPGTENQVTSGTCNTCIQTEYKFTGVASHAAGAPEQGRSALDAVELTDIGANYLREHVPSDVRIHYTIVDGGVAPNIVPDKAVVWYYMRAFSREVVENVYERLVKVAKGAAMMTETELEIEFLGGCYNTQNNHVLAGVVAEAMNEIPQEPWTQEELDFAAALDEQTADAARATTKKYGLSADTHLYTGPGQVTCFNSYGSTDVGDVMHLVPTAYFFTACTNMGAPAHSWQFASCAGSSIGEKGMIYAAKVMALYGLKLIEKPELIAQAKEEFDRQMEGRSYKCPIPDGMTMPW